MDERARLQREHSQAVDAAAQAKENATDRKRQSDIARMTEDDAEAEVEREKEKERIQQEKDISDAETEKTRR